MGHTVLAPDPTSQHMATRDDLALLLADLVRAVRLDDRALLLEPPPSLCPSCRAAYSAAWQIVGDAGGVRAWVAEFERRRARQQDGGPLGPGMPLETRTW